MGFKATKASNAETNGFEKTLKYKVMHCGNVEGNNNKFFCIELQENPTTQEYRIFTHYGRLGDVGVFDIRGPVKDDMHKSLEEEYERIIRDKLKGKMVKDKDGSKRRENYVEVDVIAPTVGSKNIRKNGDGPISVQKSTTKDFANAFKHMNYGNEEQTLLTQLLEENVHNITTLTSITMTANGLETPLGPITIDHIGKSRQVLMDLKDKIVAVLKADDVVEITEPDKEVKELNTKYYSLIPHPFGRKITTSDMILNEQKLLDEFEMLDQLESAVNVSDADDNEQETKDIGLSIKEIARDSDEFIRLEKKFESTRASNHGQLRRWKVRKIFEVESKKERERYVNTLPKYGNEVELFHGSRNSNLLSILMNGFIIPPVSAPHVTGRMFGNGVYAASASTKALNYSVGYWGGRANKYKNSFLFMVKFAMGRKYETETQQYNGAPSGYDSVHAKAGRSLYNDEYIVYTLGQTTVSHIIELEEK